MEQFIMTESARKRSLLATTASVLTVAFSCSAISLDPQPLSFQPNSAFADGGGGGGGGGGGADDGANNNGSDGTAGDTDSDS